MKKVLLIASFAILLAATSCIEKLLDPELKELEPFFGKWNVTEIKGYDTYRVENETHINNEHQYKEVSGYVELTKTEDADDTYRRGKFSLTFIPVNGFVEGQKVTITEEFKWDIFKNQTLYFELDNPDGSTLGVSTVHINFIWTEELTADKYVFGITTGGDAEYLASHVLFTASK